MRKHKRGLLIGVILVWLIAVWVGIYLIEDHRSAANYRCFCFESQFNHFVNDKIYDQYFDFGDEYDRLESTYEDALNEYTANYNHNSLMYQNLYTEDQAKKLSFYKEKGDILKLAFSETNPLVEEFHSLIAQLAAAEDAFDSLDEDSVTLRELVAAKDAYVATEEALKTRFEEEMVPLLKVIHANPDFSWSFQESPNAESLMYFIDYLSEKADHDPEYTITDDLTRVELFSALHGFSIERITQDINVIDLSITNDFNRKWFEEDYTVSIHALNDKDIRSIICFSAIMQFLSDYERWDGPVTMGQRNPAATALLIIIAVLLAVPIFIVFILLVRSRKKMPSHVSDTPSQQIQPPAPTIDQNNPPTAFSDRQ